MKNRTALVGGACVLVAVAAVAIWAVGGADRQAPVEGPAVQPADQPAMVTHLDPVTGERTAVPTPEQAAQLAADIEASPAATVERASTTPGGGYGFDTPLKFHSVAIVKAESETVKVECVPAAEAAAIAEGGGE